jgi:hypothetical protein
MQPALNHSPIQSGWFNSIAPLIGVFFMEMDLPGTTPLSFVNFIVAEKTHEKGQWHHSVFVDRAMTVKHAEKFILSDEVSKSVQHLSKTTSFAKQIATHPEMFRSPYQNTWMEMPIETPTLSSRAGFLIEEKKPQLYYFSFFDAVFSNDKNRATITPSVFCVRIDLRDESFLEAVNNSVLLDKEALMFEGLTDKEADLAIHRIQIIPDPVLVKKHGIDEFYERVKRTDQRQGGSVVEDAYAAAAVCIGAWLTLLNAKTGLHRSKFSEETIQKRLSFGSRKKKSVVKKITIQF